MREAKDKEQQERWDRTFKTEKVWHPVSERPNDGTIVCTFERHHAKRRSWLAVELNIGEVATDNNGGWYVWNNDERGYGSEHWTPQGQNENSPHDGFTHWCHITDLPDMTEDM